MASAARGLNKLQKANSKRVPGSVAVVATAAEGHNLAPLGHAETVPSFFLKQPIPSVIYDTPMDRNAACCSGSPPSVTLDPDDLYGEEERRMRDSVIDPRRDMDWDEEDRVGGCSNGMGLDGMVGRSSNFPGSNLTVEFDSLEHSQRILTIMTGVMPTREIWLLKLRPSATLMLRLQKLQNSRISGTNISHSCIWYMLRYCLFVHAKTACTTG